MKRAKQRTKFTMWKTVLYADEAGYYQSMEKFKAWKNVSCPALMAAVGIVGLPPEHIKARGPYLTTHRANELIERFRLNVAKLTADYRELKEQSEVELDGVVFKRG